MDTFFVPDIEERGLKLGLHALTRAARRVDRSSVHFFVKQMAIPVSGGDTSTKRAWLLVAVAAVACVVFAIVAVILTGTHRLMFGGASLVFLVLAITAAGTVAIETSSKPRFDLDAPEPLAPLPESPVTLIHDPAENGRDRK